MSRLFKNVQYKALRTKVTQDSSRNLLKVAVALQGGGAFGAFEWGVLDRLLQEKIFMPAALSGASAGALNATLVAHGLLEGGHEGARQALDRMWKGIGRMAQMSPMQLPGIGMQMNMLAQVFSPYQFNPFNINPIRDLLESIVDFKRLRRKSPIPLFISATNVRTGMPRIFREHEISTEVLMASTCIPYVSQAIEIDGERYWDGGFSANPPILPVVLESSCDALVVVKLMPEIEPNIPTTSTDIQKRAQRIMFNAPLIRDLAALEDLCDTLRQQERPSPGLKRIRDLRMVSIAIEHSMVADESEMNPRPEFLKRLKDAGHAIADKRLAETKSFWLPNY